MAPSRIAPTPSRSRDGGGGDFGAGLVLAGLDDFLRDERSAMKLFVQDRGRGAFTASKTADDDDGIVVETLSSGPCRSLFLPFLKSPACATQNIE